MAQITAILLYPEDNYLHYHDTDIKRGVFHGSHANQEDTIELLRLDGADEIAVIVKDHDPDIPALQRVQEFAKAGYWVEANKGTKRFTGLLYYQSYQ